MCTQLPRKGAVIRVHEGVKVGDRDMSGMLLTVVDAHALVELDVTEWTGDRPIHLMASQVDIVTQDGAR